MSSIYVLVNSETGEPHITGDDSRSSYHRPRLLVYTDLRKAKAARGTANYGRDWKNLPKLVLMEYQLENGEVVDE